MSWQEILKEEDKWKPERETGWKKEPRGTPVKRVGSELQWGMDENVPIPEDTSDIDTLAEQTREDIMDMVMDKIGQMSKKELIDLLIETKGKLEEIKV